MHLLYLHQYYCPPGGWGNNRSYDFARFWVAAGHRVTVVTSAAMFPPQHAAHRQSITEMEIEGVRVIVLNVPYRQRMGIARRLWAFYAFWRRAQRVLRDIVDADIVYASSTPPTVGELGRRHARRNNIPYVFETVDVWPDVPIGMGIVKNPIAVWAANRFVNRIYRDAAAIVALSEGMRDQVLVHGVLPTKVHVAHNGTDTDAIRPTVKHTEGPVQLLYAGTLGLANGAEALVQAVHALNQQGLQHKFTCRIVGDGSRLPALQQLVTQLRLPNLQLLPPVPKQDVNALLAGAHVGVSTFLPVPVLQANSANKFFDYLAAGLPVVCNYLGWQAHYLQAHRCGLASAQQDNEAFINNLKTLITDTELRRQMGIQARALAVSHFDRKKMAGKVLAICTDVLAGGIIPP
jgi:glycosyltransferase involved in cell wall biosynthesis